MAAALWGFLVALVALGGGEGGPPTVTPDFGGRGTPNLGGGTTPRSDNGSSWGGGGAGSPPKGGLGGSFWGSLGALTAAYLGLGGAVLVGLHRRHQALQNRKRRRVQRGPARRFFRMSPLEPQNPYGNVPGPRPSPPVPPPQRPQQEEEGEGDEGYEDPESGSYENAPAALGGGAGWPYEVMAAGEGHQEPPWRGRGGEEDAASYENMEGPLG